MFVSSFFLALGWSLTSLRGGGLTGGLLLLPSEILIWCAACSSVYFDCMKLLLSAFSILLDLSEHIGLALS